MPAFATPGQRVNAMPFLLDGALENRRLPAPIMERRALSGTRSPGTGGALLVRAISRELPDPVRSHFMQIARRKHLLDAPPRSVVAVRCKFMADVASISTTRSIEVSYSPASSRNLLGKKNLKKSASSIRNKLSS